MKRAIWTMLPVITMLVACSQQDNGGNQSSAEIAVTEADAPANKFGFKEEMSQGGILARNPAATVRDQAEAAAADAAEAAATTAENAASQPSVDNPGTAPRIAYAYTFGFIVSAKDMPGLQKRHAALCEKMGPQTCRVLNMSQSSAEDDYAYGELVMEVAAPKAKTFGDELEKATEGTGGSLTSRAISGEDLSKKIIDTEARLRARTLLRDRLMELLASRKGTVAELIEAERGVAEVNEEIDEAQSLLKEMRGRVDFSRVEINYASSNGSRIGFLAPIVSVLNNIGSILGVVIAGLIAVAISLVPIGLFVFGLFWLRRRLRAWVAQRSATPTEPNATPES